MSDSAEPARCPAAFGVLSDKAVNDPARAARLDADRLMPHPLRHSFAVEARSVGAALQDVQDPLGHADPRTTRHDRSGHNLERSPAYLLAATLAGA